MLLKSLLAALIPLGLLLAWQPKAQAAALDFDITSRQPTAVRATTKAPRPVALKFAPDRLSVAAVSAPKPAPNPLVKTQKDTPYPLSDLFLGGPTSLVSKTVGSAEGTRTPDGGYTSAYYGHVDPGNGVWNLGSFSYQHGASSPEQADRKQLRRLQQQAKELRRQTQAKSFQLSLLEELNGIDLANQAPLAALDRGYIHWLHQAQSMDLPERIVWARTKAFIDPDTGYWDAPGLGNHWDSIYRDQLRRYDAIARTLELEGLIPSSMRKYRPL